MIYLVTLMAGIPAISVKAAAIEFTGEELLGRPTDTSITINVVPDEDISLFYEYGTSSGVYTLQTTTTATTGGQPHETLISGLTPNTQYYYRMQYHTSGDPAWVVRPEHTFHTQRAQGSTFTFTITSDSHVNILLGSASTWTNTLNDVTADHPDFSIDLGDTVAMRSVSAGDAAGAEAAYIDQLPFFNLISASVPIFLAPGNHEQQEGWHLLAPLSTSLPVIGTNAEKKYFLNPVPNSFYSGDASTYTYLSGDQLREDYYAWTWGNALFVVIDPYWFSTTKPYVTDPGGGETDTTGSGDSWDWTLGKDQFDWFKETLENSDAKYKFVFSHQMVGGGSISGQADYGHGGANYANLVEWGGYNENGTTWGWDSERPGWGSEPIHQLMVTNGVSAFFHGHDHQYAYEMLDGIVYQSVPSAGFSGNGFSIYTSGDGNTIEALPSSGHLKVTVSPSLATVDYIQTSQTTSAYTYYIAAAGATFDLTTAVTPAGGGTINPAAGSHAYTPGEVVDVTATPNAGYVFDHWSGACTGSGPCQVTMDDDKSVTANFATYVPGSLAYIGDIGSATIKNSGNADLVLTTSAAVAAGDAIVIAYATDPSQDLNVSVTDSAGNKYQQAAMAINVGNLRTYVFAAYNVTALPSGGTITIHQDVYSTTAVAARAAVASVFRGLAPSGALEQSSVSSQTSGTTPSSGAATTVKPVQLLIGAVGTEGPGTDSAGAWQNSFSEGPRAGTTATTTDAEITVSMGWRIVSASGSYTAAKSSITSRDSATAIATFKTSDAGISYIGDIGSAQSKTTGSSLTVTTDAAVTAGDDILVTFAADEEGTVSSVSDSAGNTYQLAVQIANDQSGAAAGVRTYIYAAYNALALPSGGTITINHASIAARSAVVSVFRGLADSAVVDQTHTGTGTSNAVTSGATSTTTQADELLIGAVGLEGPNVDAPSVWQNSFSYGPRLGTSFGSSSGDATDITAQMGWRIVGSTGAYTAQIVNLNTTRDWAAAIATFKAASAVVNQAPVVGDIPNQTVSEGSPFATINLDNYVSDPDNSDAQMSWSYSGQSQLSVSITDRVATITTPNADWNGAETITFRATDPGALYDEDAATFTVTPVNDAPVAVNDSYTAVEDQTLNISAPGVLGNDSDVDLDGLTAQKVSDPAHGSLTLNADGSFAYTPDTLFSGSDSFTYQANDGALDSNIATVTLNVGAVNHAPVCSAASLTTDEDTSGQTAPACTDADGDTLSYSIAAQPSHGTAAVVSGMLSYSPAANFNGADSFTYQANDGTLDSNVATVSVSVTPVNDAPVLSAIGDKSVDELTALSFTAQASDVDGDELTFSLDSGAPTGATIQPTSGLFSWTPSEAQGPGSYPVTVRVSDGTTSDSETLTVSVAEVNQAPVAAEDAYTTEQDTPLNVLVGDGVLANDDDPDGNTITAVLVNLPEKGILALNPDGSFSYTPEAGFTGTVTFTYRAYDGQMYSAVTQVRIQVTGAPVSEPVKLFLPLI